MPSCGLRKDVCRRRTICRKMGSRCFIRVLHRVGKIKRILFALCFLRALCWELVVPFAAMKNSRKRRPSYRAADAASDADAKDELNDVPHQKRLRNTKTTVATTLDAAPMSKDAREHLLFSLQTWSRVCDYVDQLLLAMMPRHLLELIMDYTHLTNNDLLRKRTDLVKQIRDEFHIQKFGSCYEQVMKPSEDDLLQLQLVQRMLRTFVHEERRQQSIRWQTERPIRTSPRFSLTVAAEAHSARQMRQQLRQERRHRQEDTKDAQDPVKNFDLSQCWRWLPPQIRQFPSLSSTILYGAADGRRTDGTFWSWRPTSHPSGLNHAYFILRPMLPQDFRHALTTFEAERTQMLDLQRQLVYPTKRHESPSKLSPKRKHIWSR